MRIFDILTTLKNTKSTNEKMEILEANKDNLLLKEIFRLVYTKQINFGIRGIDEEHLVSDLPFLYEHDDALSNVVLVGLENLINRTYTGNRAIEYVTSFKEVLDDEQLDIIRRILNRNLECGIGATIPSKVWKDLIPKQPQMLCNPCNAKNLSRINYPAISQVKEDGARCFVEIDTWLADGRRMYSINYMTRNNNSYESLGFLNDYIEELLEHIVYKDYVGHLTLDGELIVMENNVILPREIGNGILNKALKNTASPEELSMIVFSMWDVYFNFANDKSPYENRYLCLLNAFNELIPDTIRPIRLVESREVLNEDQARNHSLECIENGKEGTILKNKDSVWRDGRSPNQVKFKEEILVDLEVIDVVENKSVDQKGTMGSLTLKSRCGRILVNCGSGFTNTREVKQKDGSWLPVPLSERPESDREWLWVNRNDIIGRIVEVKCNALTTSDGRDTYSLFLPIFLRFRDDKDEANTLEEVF